MHNKPKAIFVNKKIFRSKIDYFFLIFFNFFICKKVGCIEYPHLVYFYKKENKIKKKKLAKKYKLMASILI